MRKRVEGVQERILACATEEFLEKGYADASLRTIAEKAETSTNSIYVRFRDKEGLFSAIVEPVAETFMERFITVQETFHSFGQEVQQAEMEEYSSREMLKMVDYIYDHRDRFRLLLDASYSPKYHDFVDRLVAVEEEYTWKWMEVTGYRPEVEGAMTRELYHMIVSSYFEGIFQVIRRDISREDAKNYVVMLGKYHHAGFRAIAKEEP